MTSYYRDYDEEERAESRRRAYRDDKRKPYLSNGFDIEFESLNLAKINYIHCLVCGCVVHDTNLHREICEFDVDTQDEAW